LLFLKEESASMYPNELDGLYGDAILMKVVEKYVDDDVDCKAYEIIDVLTDPFMLDQFFHFYMPAYGAYDRVGGKQSPLVIYDALSSNEYESLDDDLPSCKRKRDFGIIGESDLNSTSSCKLKTKSEGFPNTVSKFDAVVYMTCTKSV
jgi:hypothetical protein